MDEEKRSSLKGIVKFVNNDKGFGFITDSGGQVHFLHLKNIKGNVELKQDDEVEFEIREGRNGKYEAYDVQIIKTAKTQEHSNPFLKGTEIEIVIDQGTADDNTIADLLSDISILYRMMDGSGINFEFSGILNLENTHSA